MSRDASTGKELARSNQFPKMSAGILVTPGYAGLQYLLAADGHIIVLVPGNKAGVPTVGPEDPGPVRSKARPLRSSRGVHLTFQRAMWGVARAGRSQG